MDSEKYNTKNNLQQISCLGLSKIGIVKFFSVERIVIL